MACVERVPSEYRRRALRLPRRYLQVFVDVYSADKFTVYLL